MGTIKLDEGWKNLSIEYYNMMVKRGGSFDEYFLHFNIHEYWPYSLKIGGKTVDFTGIGINKSLCYKAVVENDITTFIIKLLSVKLDEFCQMATEDNFEDSIDYLYELYWDNQVEILEINIKKGEDSGKKIERILSNEGLEVPQELRDEFEYWETGALIREKMLDIAELYSGDTKSFIIWYLLKNLRERDIERSSLVGLSA